MVEGAVQPNKHHIVTVLQLTSWPVKGLPHPTAVISLIDHLTNAQMRSSTRRTVLICRSGVHLNGPEYRIAGIITSCCLFLQ